MTIGNVPNAAAGIPRFTLEKEQFRELKALKRNNCHGDACEYAAMELCLHDLALQFLRINQQHIRQGYLDSTLYSAMRRGYERLLQQARLLLSPEQYQQFYMCF